MGPALPRAAWGTAWPQQVLPGGSSPKAPKWVMHPRVFDTSVHVSERPWGGLGGLLFFFVFDNLGNLGSVPPFCNVRLKLIQARPDADHRYASVNLNGVAYVLLGLV